MRTMGFLSKFKKLLECKGGMTFRFYLLQQFFWRQILIPNTIEKMLNVKQSKYRQHCINNPRSWEIGPQDYGPRFLCSLARFLLRQLSRERSPDIRLCCSLGSLVFGRHSQPPNDACNRYRCSCKQALCQCVWLNEQMFIAQSRRDLHFLSSNWDCFVSSYPRCPCRARRSVGTTFARLI